MPCHDPNRSSGVRPRLLYSLALTLGLLAAAPLALGGDGPPRSRPAPKPLWQLTLERLSALTPAERLALIAKAGLGDLATRKVARGPLRVEIVERGTLEAARSSDVICTVRARNPGGGTTIASTIKWIVDPGAEVKKGEKVMELDDSGWRAELGERQVALKQAMAAREKAEQALELVRAENQVDLQLMEIAVRLAELRLKREKGADRDLKEELQLKLDQARLHLKRARSQAQTRLAEKEADLRSRRAVYEQAMARAREAEAEIRKCTLFAPQDGIVLYHVPESVRGGTGAQPSIVAQGEPVREGQKMLQIPDLSRMVVNVRVHEALVAHLRNEEDPKDKSTWQHARILVDAYPDRTLRGHVKRVDTMASQQDWFASDVKVYKTVVTIDQPPEGLRPGMSAEVRIVANETAGPVLNVPVQSVVAAGKKRFCWILTEKNLEEREVVTGLANDHAVEIRSGLKEGEWVVVSPRALARRVASWLQKRGQAGGDVRGPLAQPPASIFVHSVKPTNEGAPRRSWIARYGLTYQDGERIAALPTVLQTVPVRTFPHEARRPLRICAVTVVATTPAFADLRGLEIEEGRFLSEEDDLHRRNVVVLGAIVAEELFPAEDPVGAAVVVGKHPYRVVGVLREQDEQPGVLGATNRAIYLPLATCKVRFGGRLFTVQGARRAAEEVALHAILVTVRDPRHVRDTIEDIREILGQAHADKDWAVEGPAGS
jgi:RND family efflux transporter MFP subunit